MSILTLLESWSKNKAIPIIYLVGILYLFLIDIVVVIQLGYEPKDISSLINIEKILLFNTFIITIYAIFALTLKKHLIVTATIVFFLTAMFATSHDLDFQNYFSTVAMIVLFIIIIVFNVYKNFIEPWIDDSLWKIISVNLFFGVIIAFMTIIYVDKSIYKWDAVIKTNNKLELNRASSPFLILEPKSFNTIYLQELNQNLKLFVNSKFIKNFSKQLYIKDNVNNQNFVVIPNDDTVINNMPITVYYYNVGNIKNIFIINPNTCNKKGECELQTLITKAVNKNNVSQGYQLIANYTSIVYMKD